MDDDEATWFAAMTAAHEVSEAQMEAEDEMVKRPPGCLCHLEWGDSPCPVHGDDDA
jgi:hypothetical protein